jgi:hypothetical protein
MARARSPEYPAISLGEAIDRVKMVYEKDYQNRLPKAVVAEHMGYKGLSGASLPVISALAKYGLLEGRADETRVTDLAVTLIAHPSGSVEHYNALMAASVMPELFAELNERFPDGKASEQAIRAYLLTRKFIPVAADAAIRAYRDTKLLVASEAAGYSGSAGQEPQQVHQPNQEANSLLDRPANSFKRPMTMHEKFALDEGEVTVSYPSELSPESYQDMKDRIDILMRQLKRRADAEGERRRRDRDDVPE